MHTASFLSQPSAFMPVLAEAIQDELAFFSHDMNGRIMYLSKSAENVLNQDPNQWLNRPFWDLLTDEPCNQHIRIDDVNVSNELKATGRVCEIFDRNGKRIKLKFWRVQHVQNGVLVGLSGVIRRLDAKNYGAERIDTVGKQDLLSRVASLTDVERRVVEMVVDGYMNKEIAATLKVAVRTIESRRSRGMIKLKSRTLPELVQTWVQVRSIETNLNPVDPLDHSHQVKTTKTIGTV